MRRAGRRGDPARWVGSKIKEYKRIDAMCKAAWEREKMHDTQRELCAILHHADYNGRKVLVAEPHGKDGILLMVSRPGTTRGTDEIILRIEKHE